MKLLSRFAAIAALFTAASPAFAHHAESGASTAQTVLHWLANPVHAVPVLGALVLAAYAVKSRRQRG
ncbi:MAG: hypothetical protein V3U82_00670 [Robiginitomaculum sp.]